MRVNLSELICRFSIQRDSCATGAKAMSASFDGREAFDSLRTNLSCEGPACRPGIIGSHRVAGATVGSSGNFRGPTSPLVDRRKSVGSRSPPPSRARPAAVETAPASPLAAKVSTETSGPNAGPAPKAGGAPGGSFERSCASRREEDAAPSAPKEVMVRKSLRDLDMVRVQDSARRILRASRKIVIPSSEATRNLLFLGGGRTAGSSSLRSSE